jgi:4'-phosphopantetheinyl transferase
MPLLHTNSVEPDGVLGIWEITEPESYFLQRMQLQPSEVKQLAQLKGMRRQEWLAVRFLLHTLSGRAIRGACLKDEFGKPYLENSEFQISMSHTKNAAAVIASSRPVGIDIQQIVPKISNIAYKFMRPEEMNALNAKGRIQHLHIYWGAKECLYKAYGRKKLDFRDHLYVEPFTLKEMGTTAAWLRRDGINKKFDIHYHLIKGEFMLVFAQEHEIS